MKTFARVLFFLLLPILLVFVPRTSAQTKPNGPNARPDVTLQGNVTDPRGASIGDAFVKVSSIPTPGISATADSAKLQDHIMSASDGGFRLLLPPGRYRVTISHESFLPVNQDVTLAAGETRQLEIHMALEPLSASVVVTAQTIPLDADSTPAPVTIVTRENIEQREATSLPDLLATLPGFSLGRAGAEGGTASLFLDGGNSNYTKVLVDGVAVNEPGGLIDFSNFSLSNIDKIEVVHGAESALYGSDAVDGVIQIFTHRGTTATPEFTAFADGGNFSTGHGGAQLSGLLDRRFDYSAAFEDMETAGQGPNDGFRNRTISGNFGWTFSDTARVSLTLRDNDSDAGTPGPTALEPANLTDYIALHHFNTGLHAEFTTGSHWHHQINAGESYNREFDFDPFSDTFLQYNRINFSAQSTYLLRTFSATGGYEYEVENGFISYLGIHARRNNQAGFLDARWQPFNRLTLSAGGRAEDDADFGTRVLPRAGAAYALRIAQGVFGDTRLRASYGNGIVEPRFDQTFGTDPCFPGNPTLSPEESRTVHAGLEQKLASNRVLISADYFESRFSNIISFGFSQNPPAACNFGAGTYFNTNLASASGAEFSGSARILRWLTATGNYTYDSTRVISAPDTSDPNYIPGSRLLRRPLNSGNMTLNAGFRRMNWNLAGYFTGRRDDYPILGLTNNPGYARLDFAGSYNLGRGVSFYCRIANLTNKQYQDVLGYPALGREFRIGVKYTTHVD